ncbi:MAG: ATP-binding cassette domain-containing protein [Candidatus Dormiibacterota bacterium]
MTLRANVRTSLGTLRLECDVTFESNVTVAVLGPNGAGKTTLLRVLAGLIPIEDGHVEVDGTVFEDTATRARLSPEARRVGFVFQDHGLFPHLSVLDNVAFGLRARGVDRATANAKASEWLARVDLASYAGGRPSALSGGQSQRAALARVLVTEPRVLLLDEPLAAVDASGRLELRRTLREHLSSFAGVRLIVTHDPLEAASLADRVVVLEDGRVTQDGSFAEVTARPRSPWIARMAGVNLLRGVVAGGVLTLGDGSTLTVASDATGPAMATIHPRAVALYRMAPDGSPRNVLRCRVGGVDPEGDRWRIRLNGPVPIVAEVTPSAATELHLADGGDVYAVVKATEVDVYPV